jgi:hypothetical protein
MSGKTNDDYFPEPDEDDDDEIDFVPGAEEDDDDDEDEALLLLDGELSLDSNQKLRYRGEGFRLESSLPIPWNVLDIRAAQSFKGSATQNRTLEFVMMGPCDLHPSQGKPTPRTMQVTLTLQDANSSVSILNGKGEIVGTQKGNEEEGLTPESKAPSVSYNIYGIQQDANGGDLLEFQGAFAPVSIDSNVDNGTSIALVCRVRLLPPAPAAVTTAATSPAAAVGSTAKDSSDEDFDDADDEVDYDELIALHEDAGLSVDDLRKRYHEGDGGTTTTESPSKRSRQPAAQFSSSQPENDDDDDDDFGF